MMISLISNGQYLTFVLILAAIVVSLSFHEFGHAWSARYFGDDTAERLGRLTLNPVAHIDPMGLMMVALVGFGWAKPVPTDPRNFNSMWASLVIAAAGPAMNLLIAFVAVNVYSVGIQAGWSFVDSPVWGQFFTLLITINVLLMLFNLIPIGPLDGHYILPYVLPRQIALLYRDLNARYGAFALLGLVLLSYFGLPVFSWLRAAAAWVIGALRLF